LEKRLSHAQEAQAASSDTISPAVNPAGRRLAGVGGATAFASS
jgi:hypothetical protein